VAYVHELYVKNCFGSKDPFFLCEKTKIPCQLWHERNITTAVKSPKTGYTVDDDVLKTHLPILEAELALFPNLKVIMLMGNVAKKAVNMIN
jgi:uracil-DNA glycosylase